MHLRTLMTSPDHYYFRLDHCLFFQIIFQLLLYSPSILIKIFSLYQNQQQCVLLRSYDLLKLCLRHVKIGLYFAHIKIIPVQTYCTIFIKMACYQHRKIKTGAQSWQRSNQIKIPKKQNHAKSNAICTVRLKCYPHLQTITPD